MWKDAVGGDEVSFKLRALVPRFVSGVVSELIISSPAWYGCEVDDFWFLPGFPFFCWMM